MSDGMGLVGGEWREDVLGSVLEVKYGKDHKEIEDGNIPCFGSGGLMRNVGKSLYDKISILIPRKGSLNNIMFQDKPFWTVDTMFWSKINEDLVFPKFLFYQLTLIDYTVLNVGSAVPSLTIPVINEVDITLPPLPEQKAIAEVLSSLDDKIDLLHRQNKTLEAMAETLFRQWFVEEAEEGWEKGKLGDIADNPRVSIKSSQVMKDTKYIGLEHIERKNISLMYSGDSESVVSNKYEFKEYDILFGKLRPYFHKVCFTSHGGICSTDILVIRPREVKYFAFTLFAFFKDDVIKYANSGSEGTRMPRTNWNILKEYPIKMPDDDFIKKFNVQVLSMIEKIKKNQKQIKTLEQTRDTLLPKLMSGEVRVRI